MPEIKRDKNGHFVKGTPTANPSGRPKGALSKRTRAIAERAAAEGISPLEVLLTAMRAAHAAGRTDDAARYAGMACPYIHPRLQAVEHAGNADRPVKLEVSWRHGDNEAPELPAMDRLKTY
jgi:hypothetical protein